MKRGIGVAFLLWQSLYILQDRNFLVMLLHLNYRYSVFCHLNVLCLSSVLGSMQNVSSDSTVFNNIFVILELEVRWFFSRKRVHRKSTVCSECCKRKILVCIKVIVFTRNVLQLTHQRFFKFLVKTTLLINF